MAKKVNKRSEEKAVEKALKSVKKQPNKIEEKQKELSKKWTEAVRNFTRRKNTVERVSGVRVHANIKRPERITQKDINWLNKQLRSRGKPEKAKSTKRLDISYETVPESELQDFLETVPTPKPIREKRIKEQLLAEGYDENAIAFFTKQEGWSMEETADYLRRQDEEAADISFSEEDTETAVYYYDPDTGERYSPDDPRIYDRDSNGKYKYEWDNDTQQYRLKIRDDLELHSGEPLTPEMLKDLQWSNFIGNFKVADSYRHFEGINPTSIFEELKNEIGQDLLFDILNEVSDYGSNVADISFWYEEEESSQADKLQTIISLAQKKTGKDFGYLLREVSDYAGSMVDRGNFSGSMGADRQINRGGRK